MISGEVSGWIGRLLVCLSICVYLCRQYIDRHYVIIYSGVCDILNVVGSMVIQISVETVSNMFDVADTYRHLLMSVCFPLSAVAVHGFILSPL